MHQKNCRVTRVCIKRSAVLPRSGSSSHCITSDCSSSDCSSCDFSSDDSDGNGSSGNIIENMNRLSVPEL